MSLSDYGNMMASADSAGEVVGFMLAHLKANSRTIRYARWVSIIQLP